MSETNIFHHGGALGDFVLCWPLLRAIRERGETATVVTTREKGELAARELGVRSLDAERAQFRALWLNGAGDVPRGAPVRGVRRVF